LTTSGRLKLHGSVLTEWEKIIDEEVIHGNHVDSSTLATPLKASGRDWRALFMFPSGSKAYDATRVDRRI